MYPVTVILVGIEDTLLPHIRREVNNQGAVIEGEFREVGTAIAALHPVRKQPRLFIHHFRSAADETPLRRLFGTFAESPVLSLVNDPAENLLRVNRAGARQLVPLPLVPEDFQAAMKCIAIQVGARQECPVIAVTGVTGGCGTTTVAANLAYELAIRHGRHTILVELAQKMGALATYLNVEPRITLPDLLLEVERVDVFMVQQALVKIVSGFEILASTRELTAPGWATAQNMVQIIELVREMADLVLLDLPCTLDQMQFDLLAHADQILLIAEQSITAVRALRLVLETLGHERSGALRIVINGYDPELPGFNVEELERVLHAPSIATIPEDNAAVRTALNLGRPIRLVAPHSRALAAIAGLADALTGEQAPVVNDPLRSGFFSRILQAFKR